MKISFGLALVAVAFLFAGLPAAAGAAGFTITTDGLADNAMLPKADAYDKMSADHVHPCGGVNHAPGFAWANVPAKTQSFAILEVDRDGRLGLGVNHWVIYNIPAAATGISSAEIAAGKYTPGRGTGNLVGYRGPCPPAGDAPHHYIVQLFASDLPPALPAGLDHDGVMAAMKGHVLHTATTIMRYQSLP